MITSPTRKLGEELTLFIRHINSLRITLPFTAAFIQEVAKTANLKLNEFEDEFCTVITEGEKRKITIPHEHYNKWRQLYNKSDKIGLSNKLFPKSIFVSAISQYDAFLSRILKIILQNKQELLNRCEK